MSEEPDDKDDLDMMNTMVDDEVMEGGDEEIRDVSGPDEILEGDSDYISPEEMAELKEIEQNHPKLKKKISEHD